MSDDDYGIDVVIGLNGAIYPADTLSTQAQQVAAEVLRADDAAVMLRTQTVSISRDQARRVLDLLDQIPALVQRAEKAEALLDKLDELAHEVCDENSAWSWMFSEALAVHERPIAALARYLDSDEYKAILSKRTTHQERVE